MFNLRIKFILITASLFLGLIFTPAKTLSAQTVYFQDNFDDGEASDWTIVRNTCLADWVVENNKYGIRINRWCTTESLPNTINIPPDISYSFEVDMTMSQSIYMDRNFVFKYQDSNNWYGIHAIGTRVYLQKVVNGVEYFLPNWFIDYPFQDNQTYRFKLDVMSNQFRVYIDGSLVNTVADSNPNFPNSKAGLQASAGAISTSEVWFDNVVVTSLDPSITPTPPTPIPTIGPFELPFSYTGRLENNPPSFKTAFWGRLTAAFDHLLRGGTFRPFTGATYDTKDCSNGKIGITCYDSHNGTDFSTVGGQEVFSVGSGTVVYTSEHTDTSCTPNKGGYGCVVIIEYPGNTFGLYAHLDKIFVNTAQEVTPVNLIGEMGATGCPNCGEHLHFGVMQPITTSNSVAKRMSKADWKELLYRIKPNQSPSYKPACTYTAPNGVTFAFRDPLGWKGSDIDPWSNSKRDGGCGTTSPYLWKFEVDTAS